MSTLHSFTPAEAKAWVESRVWANGWDANPDATTDPVEFAAQYAAAPELWNALFKFLAETDLKTLPAGKHEIIPGRVWVNLLEYTPKDEANTKIENHDKFIDLQYLIEGDELMGLADKVTPTGAYDPVKDRTNYTADSPVDYVPAGPDRFFLYFPKDMHQPSVAADPAHAVPSRKVVGKIEYQK